MKRTSSDGRSRGLPLYGGSVCAHGNGASAISTPAPLNSLDLSERLAPAQMNVHTRETNPPPELVVDSSNTALFSTRRLVAAADGKQRSSPWGVPICTHEVIRF